MSSVGDEAEAVVAVLTRRRRLLGLAGELGTWADLLSDRVAAMSASPPYADSDAALAASLAAAVGREPRRAPRRAAAALAGDDADLLPLLESTLAEVRALWAQTAGTTGTDRREYARRCRSLAERSVGQAEQARAAAAGLGDQAAAMLAAHPVPGLVTPRPGDLDALLDALLATPERDGPRHPWQEDRG